MYLKIKIICLVFVLSACTAQQPKKKEVQPLKQDSIGYISLSALVEQCATKNGIVVSKETKEETIYMDIACKILRIYKDPSI